MNLYSDPVIQFYDPPVVCSVCGEHGHSKKSCLYTRAKDLANLSYEDRVFWSYVQNSDKPEALLEEDEQGDQVEQEQEIAMVNMSQDGFESMDEEDELHQGGLEPMVESEQEESDCEGFDSEQESNYDSESSESSAS